ncbi:MAG TPA: EAL domain-containing protein [Acidimicrobiia bacterium]|nr:EAL domain-containing protein [Acidimicrobiia bacterium]
MGGRPGSNRRVRRAHQTRGRHDASPAAAATATPATSDPLATLLFEAVGQPVALLRCDDRLVLESANQAYADLVGLPTEALRDAPVTVLLDDETAAIAEAEVRKVVESRQRRSYAADVELSTGTRRFETLLVPVDDPEPATRVLAIVRDLAPATTTEAALRTSEQRFASLASSSAVGVFYTDADGGLLYGNQRLEEILGIEEAAMLGPGWWQVVHPDDAGKTAEALRRVMMGETVPPLQIRVSQPQGGTRWIEVRCAPVKEEDAVVGYVGTVEDRTSTVESIDLARQLGSIVEVTSDWVGLADTDGYLRYLNRAAREFHGFAPGEALGTHHVLDLYTRWSRRKFATEVIPTLEEHGRWQGELAFRSVATGSEVHVSQVIQTHRDPDGTVRWFSSIARDITERKEFEDQLAHQALHDPLTGLPNRALFMDRLGQALSRAARGRSDVVVLFLDVDRFKVVNDSLGHDAGDEVLRVVGARLRAALRPSDTVARLGGDEFVLLCEDVEGDAEGIAARVEDCLRAPIDLPDGEVFVTVSIGVARGHGVAAADAEALLRDADVAMYRAKQRGRARYEVFDERMRAQTAARVRTETELRHAIDRDELVVHYQPLVDLARGQIVGVEALVRWDHPERGLLPPSTFVPLAEEAGLIVPLGDAVLRQACRQVSAWRAERPDRSLALWVNLSARQLNHLGLLETIERVVEEFDLAPGGFGLEITETVLMEDADTVEATLRTIADMGIALAIDDFGTGYSSLSNLKRFPVSALKVDRSFVSGLGREPEDSAIVTAQVGMAQALGIQVIAEGVESERQLVELRTLGCDHAQGYLFSPPLSGPALSDLLDLEPSW